MLFFKQESDIKQISKHFKPLVDARKEQEALIQKEKEEEPTRSKFAPTINRKSQFIVDRKADSLLYTKTSGRMQRAESESGINVTRKRADAKHEDYLIGKATEYK